MKIITYGKRDYYDSAMAYLSEPDKGCIYKRELSEVWTKKSPVDILLGSSSDVRHNNISKFKPYVLFFCGKVYPFIKVIYESSFSTQLSTYESKEDEFIYSLDEYHKFLKENELELKNKKNVRSGIFSGRSNIMTEKGVKEFFEQSKKDYSKIHHELKSPVVLLEYSYGNNQEGIKHFWQYKITINPNLKSLNFVKVISPTEAFQEIYMYLGGFLSNNEDPSDNISDEIKRNQKGFDEFSFKTMKGDKKPRKKNRNKMEK